MLFKHRWMVKSDMAKRVWNWWKAGKDIWETTVIITVAIGAIAVIISLVLLALVQAIRSLSLPWQTTLIVAIFVLLLTISYGSIKTVPLIPVRWNVGVQR